MRSPPISPEDGARAIAEYLEASDWIGRKAILTANYPALRSLAKAPEPPESPQPDLESRISILFVVLNCCEENGGIEALDGCLPMVLQFLVDQLPRGAFDPAQRRQGYAREALLLARHVGYADVHHIEMWLATSLLERSSEDRPADVGEAISLLEPLLPVWNKRKSPQEWAGVRLELGLAYIDVTGPDRASSIARGIELLTEAAKHARTVEDHRMIGLAESGLGDAYSALFAFADLSAFDKAVAHYDAALEAASTTQSADLWALIHMNLGHLLFNDGTRERRESLERAIAELKLAATFYSEVQDAAKWSQLLVDLSFAYRERLVGDPLENADMAVGFALQGVESASQRWDPVGHANARLTLARALYARATLGGPARDLLRAEQAYQALLATDWLVTQSGLYATAVMGLANTLGRQARSQDVLASYEYIATLEWLLDRVDRQDDPGVWSTVHYNLGVTNAELAAAGDDARVAEAETHFLQALEERPAEVRPQERFAALEALALLRFDFGRWSKVLDVVVEAMEVADRLFAISYTPSGQTDAIAASARVGEIGAFAAFRLDRPDEALRLADWGRNRLAAVAALEGRAARASPHISQLLTEIRSLEYQARTPALHPSLRSDRELARKLEQVRKQLHDTRHIPTPALPALDDVYRAVPPDGALAVFLSTRKGSVAIVATDRTAGPRLTHVPVNDLPKLGPDLETWLRAYVTARHTNDVAEFQAVLSATVERVWSTTMGPLHEHLQQVGVAAGSSVVIVPPAGFSILPLAAASPHDGASFLDLYATSFTPSLSSLIEATRETSSGSGSLFCVGDPRGDLPNAAAECESVEKHFDGPSRVTAIGPSATVSLAVDELARAAYAHFACHGRFSWQDPLASGLALADGELSLRILMALTNQSRPRLAVLSACESAVTDLGLYREFLGLPSWFLAAGYRGVIATLWPVETLSTALLIDRFYSRHLFDGASPPQALRDAQRWLRGATRAELATQVLNWAADRDDDDELRAQAYSLALAGRSADHPFTHPYFWGGFTHWGT